MSVQILREHLQLAAFAKIQTSVDVHMSQAYRYSALTIAPQIWLASSFTVDVLIAGCMIWLVGVSELVGDVRY